MQRDIGSEIIRPTRDIAGPALSQLREQHPEELTLLNIFGPTRLKYCFCGVPVPTKCPNVYLGRVCGAEACFKHLVRCYSLEGVRRERPDILDFPVEIARGKMYIGSTGYRGNNKRHLTNTTGKYQQAYRINDACF